MKKTKIKGIIILLVMISFLLGTKEETKKFFSMDWIKVKDLVSVSEKESCPTNSDNRDTDNQIKPDSFHISMVQEYTGKPYSIVNDGMPYFIDEDVTNESYVELLPLDKLGRCQVAMACLGPEIMPKKNEERGEIGNVKPSGWCQNKYDCVQGKYVVNRCHMIGWLLSGINGDERNLITGTRYMNLEMLEFEEMVARYIKETGNHVMYRATPIFIGEELMAHGLLLEGYSVEDNGKEICFNVYFYNVQPGVEFNYNSGENWYTGEIMDPDSVAVEI